jgi:hypothetical protein
VRGFLIVCATLLIAIAIGVTTIAVQSPPGFYECPTTKYCVDLARAVGVTTPILVFSESELTKRTGLLVKDRLFYFGDFLDSDHSDVPGEPLWSLRYDLNGGNGRPLYFLISDDSLWSPPGCARQLVKLSGGLSNYVTRAVAPGGRRFCYGSRVSGRYLVDLEVWGRLGSLGYILRLNTNLVRAFPGGATSPAALRWVENVVGSLRVDA